jgi:hypothetical protein
VRPLALLLVLLAALPILADTLHFGPEQPLGSLALGPAAAGTQRDARVATSGDGALAVWNDGRDPNHIFGTRLDRDGRVLDATGINLAEGYEADVVWTGAEYVVGVTSGCGAVQLLRATTAGEVAPLAPVFASGTSCGDRIAMAAAGDRVMAVIRANGGVRYAVVSLSGRAVVASQVLALGGDVIDLDLATDGRDFLIAALTLGPAGSVIPETARVSSDGALLDRRQLGTFTGFRDIAVGWTGSAYLVAWAGSGITGQLVTAGNAIQGERLALVASSVPTAAPVLAGTLLSYSNVTATGEVLAKTLARIAGATVTQTDQFLVTAGGGDSMQADLAGDFYVWFEKGDVFAAKLENGARRNPTVLTFSAGTQRFPAVASDGTARLAAWVEDGALVAQLLPSSTPINLGGANGNVALVVVFDGNAFNVFWAFGYRLLLRRIAPGGALLDAQPAVIAERILPDEPFAAAVGGGRVLVVRPAADINEHDLAAAIVTNGFVDRRFSIPGADTFDHLPSVTWNGADFFVAWAAEGIPVILPIPPPPSRFAILGARVSVDGIVRDPGGITIAPERPFRKEVAAASIGAEVAVFWTDAETATIRAARIAPSGAIIDGDRVLASSAAGRPVAIAEGSVYSVGWIANGKDFVMQRFSPALQAATAPTVIASANRTLSWIALAPGVAVYERYAEEPRFGFVPRVFARFLDAAVSRPRPIRR